ncbi:MAG: ferrous iron transport protein A [Methanomicrobiales archaeon]|nr:ferrous iron transport protein A [Methanomicrobiales archaeon]
MQAMPLSFLAAGTEAVVTDIRAGCGLHHRLAAMGILPERRLTVICTDRGSLIVSVAGTRYALSRGMAMKIFVGINGAGST